MKTELHECCLKNCIYKSRKISPCDELLIGKKYYHRECKKLSDLFSWCIGAYGDKIDSSIPKNLLGKAFKEMIYIKRIEPEYLRFTINYCIENNIKPNSVFSLYYIFNKRQIRQAYEDRKNQVVRIEADKVDTAGETRFVYKPKKKNGWNKVYDE